MTVYTTIPDTDIDPDKPIKSSTAYALRDNLLAVIEGDATAPKITSRTISPGGSQADGACTNATSFPGPGFYDFTTLTLTAAKTLPFLSYIRVDGNATLSDILTVQRTLASVSAEVGLLAGFGGVAADSAIDVNGTNAAAGGGAGVVGDGGNSNGAGGIPGPGGAGLVESVASAVRMWAARRALVGGNGGSSTSSAKAGGNGGGFLFLVVNGDFDATGGTIDASGTNGAAGGGEAGGGGGGGCIIVICIGTLTGGTYDVSGGDGGNDTGDGGGGGGGLIHLIATAFAGTRTKTVTGGSGPGTATDGANGLAVESTLTAGQINALLLGAK